MNDQERMLEHLRGLQESAAGVEAANRVRRVDAGVWQMLERVPYDDAELAYFASLQQRQEQAPAQPVEQAPVAVYDQAEADDRAHQARRLARNSEDRIDLADTEIRTFDELAAANPDIAATMQDTAFENIAAANPDLQAFNPGEVNQARSSVDQALVQGAQAPDMNQWREMTNA